MANPQAENGHIDIANEIAEALMQVNICPYEYRVLWFIWRKTYGWKKKTDWISLSQFSKAIGLDRRLIYRTLKKLATKNIIVINRDDKNHISYGFQKDYEKWKVSSVEMTSVIQTDDKVSSAEMTSVISIDDKLSSAEIPTKEIYTKDTNTKEIYTKDTNTKTLSSPLYIPPPIQEIETLSKPETEAVTETIIEATSESESKEPISTSKKSKKAYKSPNNTLTPMPNKKHSTASPSPTPSKNEDIPYADIVNYLNQLTGKSFRIENKQTQKHIRARWHEGYTLDNFMTVIDHQTKKWLNDHKMREYLRPETLFGTKFESYLNAPPTAVQAGFITPGAAQAIGWAEREEEREKLRKQSEQGG